MWQPTVLDVHLDGRSVWRLAHPCVQIFAFPCLKEEHIVAIVEFGKLVELVQFCLGVEFCFFAAVWKEGVKVVQEMTMSILVLE
jgi:hypothetical protein